MPNCGARIAVLRLLAQTSLSSGFEDCQPGAFSSAVFDDKMIRLVLHQTITKDRSRTCCPIYYANKLAITKKAYQWAGKTTKSASWFAYVFIVVFVVWSLLRFSSRGSWWNANNRIKAISAHCYYSFKLIAPFTFIRVIRLCIFFGQSRSFSTTLPSWWHYIPW